MEYAQYKTADFISIDIEGLDYEILSSIDLDQTQTRLVCVEHNGQEIQKYIDYGKQFGFEVLAINSVNILMGRKTINYLKIPPKAQNDDFLGRFREIVSDPLNLLIHRDSRAGLVINNYVILHTGLKVPFAGPQSYYEDFSKILVINRGVHEPLEEFVFQELINILSDNPSMIELGSYWAHYSMWLKSKRPNAEVCMVEPDPVAMKVGVLNFEHNGFDGEFINQFVGNGQFEIDSHIEAKGFNQLDVLHCDIQGYELEMLNGASRSLRSKKINYLLISTHSQNLHLSACEILKDYGYRLEVQSDYDTDTTSFDGFILASSPNVQTVFNKFEPLGRKALANAKSDQIFNYLKKCNSVS